MLKKQIIFLHVVCFQLHHEKECPAYPVVCEKCSKDSIPRAKVKIMHDPRHRRIKQRTEG